MPNFRYQYGDRPLDGYTIQHGLGRGGFGEVYYALSDSGREVALKAVQQYEDIELRGIGHCMNLKSPHLVSIFDVRHAPRGEPFVIMEYVNGPSLREIMDEAPHGLGAAKAVFLLREVAKGLSYLHQCGVVHRDLKPHNVFIDQGIVKIGDYSLSKIMTASHRSGHTVTVGTVHYMAPEIGVGRYDHTVDIYALGVMFYEMLAGVPPFRGDSVGEVLMKHINGEPELSHVAEPYAEVIRKAMAKNPRDRYQTADEMVSAALGDDQVSHRVADVSADDLTMIAQRAIRSHAQNRAAYDNTHGQRSSAAPLGSQQARNARFGTYPAEPAPESTSEFVPPATRQGFFGHMKQSCQAFCSAIGISRRGWPEYWGPARDPVGPIRRWFLAFVGMAFFVGLPTLLSGGEEDVFFSLLIWIGGGTLAALITKKILLPVVENSAGFVYRFVFGAVCSLALAGGTVTIAGNAHGPDDFWFLIGFCCCIPMWLLDWRVMSSPLRPSRIGLTPALGAGLCAIFPPSAWVVAGIAVTVQLASKYDPAVSQRFGLSFPWFHHLRMAFASLVPGRNRRGPAFGPRAAVAGRAAYPAGPVHADQVARDRYRDDAGAESPLNGQPSAQPEWRSPLSPRVVQMAHATVEANRRYAEGVRWFTREIAQAWRKPSADGAAESVQPAGHVWAKGRMHLPVNQYSAVLADSLMAAGKSLQRLVMTVIALALGLIAWILGLAINVGVAQAIAAGSSSADALEMQRFFGHHDWPVLVNKVALLVALLLAIPSLALLLFARRGKGTRHFVRIAVGASALGFSLLMFGDAFRWGRIWPEIGLYIRGGEPGMAIAQLLEGSHFTMPFLLGVVGVIVGAIVLLWPAARNAAWSKELAAARKAAMAPAAQAEMSPAASRASVDESLPRQMQAHEAAADAPGPSRPVGFAAAQYKPDAPIEAQR